MEATIKTPKTQFYLDFTYQKNEAHHITIKGLDEFWQEAGGTQTRLEIYVNLGTHQETIDVTIPFRGHRVKQYAVEFICWKVGVTLSEIEKH